MGKDGMSVTAISDESDLDDFVPVALTRRVVSWGWLEKFYHTGPRWLDCGVAFCARHCDDATIQLMDFHYVVIPEAKFGGKWRRR